MSHLLIYIIGISPRNMVVLKYMEINAISQNHGLLNIGNYLENHKVIVYFRYYNFLIFFDLSRRF